MTPFFAELARRAAGSPELPWLFFRRELDWRWRSHRQVADHLARAAAVIQNAGVRATTALPLIGAESQSALLATLAAGAAFVPLAEAPAEIPFLLQEDAKWPELAPAEPARPILELPAARGNIERYTAAALPTGPFGLLRSEQRSITLEQLEEAAAALAESLFADHQGKQPIVHLGARLDSATAASVLLACLAANAVVALEPYPPATIASLLWCRPTLVVAHAEEIAALAASWTAKAAQHSRLQRILSWGEPDPAFAVKIGVPIFRLPTP